MSDNIKEKTIRFRAWDTKNKYWWNGSNINVNPCGEVFYKEGNSPWTLDGASRFELQQLQSPGTSDAINWDEALTNVPVRVHPMTENYFKNNFVLLSRQSGDIVDTDK